MKGAVRVIIAEPCPRGISSDFTLQVLPPCVHPTPRSAIAEGDLKATSTIQMERHQEGSGVDDATVAHPQWTGFSPLDDNARGEDTTPPTRKAAPIGVIVAKAFT
jgi:hypothetical protein